MTQVEFGSLFQFIRNGMNVKQDKSGDGLPITRIETISDATVDPTRVGYAGLTEADGRDWFLQTGDILFSHINSVEHVGKCAVYRGTPAKLVHGMNLLCLRSDQTRLLPEFAKYLIRVGDLIAGGIRHSELKRIAPSIEAAYKRSRLRGDEILVSCVGSIGVVALADSSVRGFNIARAVARIPLTEQTHRVFMAAYLRTDFVQRYFTNELRTVSQPTLNIKQIAETVVVLPPLPLQQEFARRVAAVERLKAAQRAALAELDALFAALQHRAFRGEL